MAESKGKLLIVSGPSGAGKSTVVKGLLKVTKRPLEMSISATTRAPRDGEEDGVNYHFLSKEEFLKKKENGEFLECMEVFDQGHWYGTLLESVTTGLNHGKWVLLEIDVDGAQQVIEKYPDAITVFVHPGSFEELQKRLRNRKTESEEAIARRLEVAKRELGQADLYQYIVTNHKVDQAIEEICEILSSIGD